MSFDTNLDKSFWRIQLQHKVIMIANLISINNYNNRGQYFVIIFYSIVNLARKCSRQTPSNTELFKKLSLYLSKHKIKSRDKYNFKRFNLIIDLQNQKRFTFF